MKMINIIWDSPKDLNIYLQTTIIHELRFFSIGITSKIY